MSSQSGPATLTSGKGPRVGTRRIRIPASIAEIMTPAERRRFRQFAEQIPGGYEELYAPLLMLYVHAISDVEEIHAILERGGLSKVERRRWRCLLRRREEAVRRSAVDLGFTPASRLAIERALKDPRHSRGRPA